MVVHLLLTALVITAGPMFLGWFFDAWYKVSKKVELRRGEAIGSAVWMVCAPVLFVTVIGMFAAVSWVWMKY